MTQPTSYTWEVEQPAAAPPSVDPGQEFAAAGALGCDPCFLSQADLLALMDRILPPGYLDPIKAVGPGYEILQAAARALERASIGVGHLECGQFVLSATGGSAAQARVVFYRDNASAGALALKAGALVSASRGGQRFRLLADATFGPADLSTGDAVVEAEAQGYEYNVRGRRVTARGEVVAGEIDQVDLPLQDPPYADPSVRVQQFQDAQGGVPASLDALGLDRGLPRAPGEGDGPYAARVRSMADTVTPAALRRLLGRVFDPLGASARFVEGWDARLQTCWDAPASAPADFGFDSTTFVWDDPRAPTEVGRWLSEDLHRGAVVVVAPRLDVVLDFGGAWDDAAVSEDDGDFASPLGVRAASAWDLGPDFDGLAVAWDGYDSGQAAVYKGLWDSIESMAPAGMALSLELEGGR